MMQKPPDYDEKLWITLDHCPGKHYLLWNPHTFTGRIAVWCPMKAVIFNISKSGIESYSLEAQYWIKGFLAGNEPDAPRIAEGDYLPDDHPDYERWRAAIRLFPETGYWNDTDRFCEKCGEHLLQSQPGSRCPNCIGLTEQAAQKR